MLTFPCATVSQNHRVVGVGRDLCGSSGPTPLPKQGHREQVAMSLVGPQPDPWCWEDHFCLRAVPQHLQEVCLAPETPNRLLRAWPSACPQFNFCLLEHNGDLIHLQITAILFWVPALERFQLTFFVIFLWTSLTINPIC